MLWPKVRINIESYIKKHYLNFNKSKTICLETQTFQNS